jgi:hypothetical protein
MLAYCSNKVGTLKGTKVPVCRHHCQMLPVFVKQQHTVSICLILLLSELACQVGSLQVMRISVPLLGDTPLFKVIKKEVDLLKVLHEIKRLWNSKF